MLKLLNLQPYKVIHILKNNFQNPVLFIIRFMKKRLHVIYLLYLLVPVVVNRIAAPVAPLAVVAYNYRSIL